MSKKSKAIMFFVLTISVSLIFGLSSLSADTVRGVTEDTIKVGMIDGKTGRAAHISVPWGMGNVNYIKYINDTGGINGRKIDLIWEDDRFEVPRAIAKFKKLLTVDKMFVLLGCGGTTQIEALFKDIEQKRVPTYAISLAESLLKPYKKYVFTIGATYENQVKGIVDYFMKQAKPNKPRIGVCFPAAIQAGQACMKAVRERVAEYGIEVAAEVDVPHMIVDASPVVTKLRKANADYVIFAGTITPSAATVLKAAEKAGYAPVFSGTHYNTDKALIKLAKTAAKNYVAVHFIDPWDADTPAMQKIREITLKYQDKPPAVTGTYLCGYLTSLIMVEGLKRAGRDLTIDNLISAMEGFRGFKTGISGPTTYRYGNHDATDFIKFFKVDLENQKFIPITGWVKPEKL
jgi:branched-chain amino acid transport system substrate-binding protein